MSRWQNEGEEVKGKSDNTNFISFMRVRKVIRLFTKIKLKKDCFMSLMSFNCLA